MTPIIAEFVGTAILLLLGNGVVANVALKDTKGNGAGLVVVAFAWAMAVFVGVFITANVSGGHLNPAVTLGFAIAGKFAWTAVPGYIIAQLLGAAFGMTLVYLMYYPHYQATTEKGDILASFSTDPAIEHTSSNVLSEVLGTFVLVYAAFHILSPEIGGQTGSLGALDALPIGLVVLGIGMSLGGTTGYAINPARDLGPRIMHALLPIRHKGGSNWGYSWIPVIGPCIGAALAALVLMTVG